MGIHENFIGGSWTEASTAAPNVNPSNTDRRRRLQGRCGTGRRGTVPPAL